MSLPYIYFQKTKKYKIIKSLPKDIIIPHRLKNVGRRGAPQCICKKGSLTVEAAIILPLLACFFSFLLFFFRVMQVQLSVQNALEETGRSLAVLSVKELEEPDNADNYFLLAKSIMYLKLKSDTVVEQYVSGGAFGVSLLASEYEGDYISLEAGYLMEFPVSLLGNRVFFMNQKAVFRKWTGWHAADVTDTGREEMIVYVTKYGSVYHMRISCPYLDLSIQRISKEELEEARNDGGGRYKSCGRCADREDVNEMLYITAYGDNYHYSIDCSGLKRTVFQKTLAETGGMSACPKCWK